MSVHLLAADLAESRGLQRALNDAAHLVTTAEALVLALDLDLLPIDLPPASRASADQIKGIASLYLAGTLESAGLIQAADDLARMLRSGVLGGDPGAVGPLLADFWNDRQHRPSEAERLALFGRVFGMPGGLDDVAGAANRDFEELLLGLCDAIMKAADGGSQGRVREAAGRLAENLAGATNGMVLEIAREILSALAKAIAILNAPQIRTMLGARSVWDAIAAIDLRLRRPRRPTLSVLRRGRAGMAILAWLADRVEGLDTAAGALLHPDDPVLDAAIDWVDETLAIVRGESGQPTARVPAPAHAPAAIDPGNTTWRDLGR